MFIKKKKNYAIWQRETQKEKKLGRETHTNIPFKKRPIVKGIQGAEKEKWEKQYTAGEGTIQKKEAWVLEGNFRKEENMEQFGK